MFFFLTSFVVLEDSYEVPSRKCVTNSRTPPNFMTKHLMVIQKWVKSLQSCKKKKERCVLVSERAMGSSQRVEKMSAGLPQVTRK